MFQRILVASDLGEGARGVGERARELARLSGARCRLIHAIEPIPGTEDDPETAAFIEGLRQRAAERLSATAAHFGEAGVGCETRVAVGSRWRVIVDEAAAWRADLIVIGSRPTLEGGRAHLGSTSHHVFFAARCPVLVLRDDAGARD